MENVTELLGNKNPHKGKIIQQFATLTNNFTMIEMGKDEERLGHFHAKLEKTKEQLHRQLSKV
jgi:uncharacterized protein YjbJ (UPF0337 family)